MGADLDDDESSEDEDYCPDAKVMKQTDKEINKQNGTEELKGPKTGIDLLKEKKKDRDADDMWDLMNMEEDDFYKKKLKVAKTDEG